MVKSRILSIRIFILFTVLLPALQSIAQPGYLNQWYDHQGWAENEGQVYGYDYKVAVEVWPAEKGGEAQREAVLQSSALGMPRPNPFTNTVTVPYELAGEQGTLEVTDLLGKTIWQQAVAPGSSEVTIPAPNCRVGYGW